MEQGMKPFVDSLVRVLLVLQSCSQKRVIPEDHREVSAGNSLVSSLLSSSYQHHQKRCMKQNTQVIWATVMHTQAVVSLSSVTTGGLQEYELNIILLLWAANGQNTSIGRLYIIGVLGTCCILEGWICLQSCREWEKEGIKINYGSNRITRWNEGGSLGRGELVSNAVVNRGQCETTLSFLILFPGERI